MSTIFKNLKKNKTFDAHIVRFTLKYITKKHKTLTDKPPVEIYVNNIQNRVIFKI